MSVSDFDQVAELASRLTARDQLKLVAQIGQKLSSELDSATSERPPVGSPAAVLQAMRALRPLDSADGDELERAIQAGRMPPRFDGIFDKGSHE